MLDEVYIKTKKGGIFEKNTMLGFIIMLVIYLLIFFPSLFFLSFNNFPSILTGMWLFLLTVTFMILFFHFNQVDNISKSIAFINRNNAIFVVQLINSYETIEQTIDTAVNMYAANNGVTYGETNQNKAHEKDIKMRRNSKEEFSKALNDILEHYTQFPSEYHVKPCNERSALDNLFCYNIENNGLTYVETIKGTYNFLYLKSPKVIEVTKRTFTVRFLNERNELCIVKFTNCYQGIIEELNRYAEENLSMYL